ncbi:sel1 repeat family protein [Helicobacter pametensis]|uniref:sel1 repeat family protein n=1 Tax=Helicobacter pametensis TaxID=95149 RepID=UPI000487CEA9|nr:sel1 repeat family protein [Helicobacter pametensis]
MIFRLFVVLIFLMGCKDSYQYGFLLYEKGEYIEALPYLEGACLTSSLKACMMTASVYARLEPNDMGRLKALKALEQACLYGESRACEIVVHTHQKKGDAILRWLDQGCQSGNPKLCFELGKAYVLGHFGSKESTLALKFFGKSCYGGNLGGCQAALEILKQDNPYSPEIAKFQSLKEKLEEK